MNTVYLDNNATTMVAPEVLEEMLPFYNRFYGNPSSIHSLGVDAAVRLNEARNKVAALIGAESDEIVFTGCGTESDNTAILSALAVNPDKRHIVTSAVEHSAVKVLCERLSERGCRVTTIEVDNDGNLDMDQYAKALTHDTAVVSLMWANNETGVMFPVEKAAQIAMEKGIIFHTDAVQAAGKIPINMKKNVINMLSFSGHKLHAPKGVGALYIRRDTEFSPFIVGGHQEKGRRGGTENMASIIGFGKACELFGQKTEEKNARVKRLRDRFEIEIQKRVPNIQINGAKAQRLPNTSNISFQFAEGESTLLLLDQVGICASSGSACTSGSPEPSHVLLAMGVPKVMARGSVRFSMSIYNTAEEIDFVIEKLPPIIQRLRGISPSWKLQNPVCTSV